MRLYLMKFSFSNFLHWAVT